MMRNLLKLGVLLCVTLYADSLKVLIVVVDASFSHYEVFRSLIVELAERKHNLTVLSHFSSGVKPSDLYREYIMINELPPNQSHTLNLERRGNLKLEKSTSVIRFETRRFKTCDSLLSGSAVQNLVGSNVQFDVIILELFSCDCFYGVVEKFKAPVVGLSTTPIFSWYNERFGNIDNPSYIPNALFLYDNKMNFWERLENFLSVQFQNFYYNTFIGRNDVFFVKKHLNISIDDMQKFVTNYSSLLLVNTHSSLHFARPLTPNVVEVGGIHLHSKRRKLPKNIEKFINESTHGVIYFSLGSIIKGHTFPQEKREHFLRAFARLPQRVLWKWENETMPGKPDNVMIQKWMPQFDILSHPNVKAFISHGGLLGTTEAVHCGVPMVVMPQYGDQHTNAKAVEVNGGGVVLYLNEATEEKVYESLKTVLDPEFKAKAQALSERFRDRPMSPMDTAIYWVEYVARHKGAPHLRTAAVGMPLYQYLLLDVLAFLAAIILSFLYILYKITLFIVRAFVLKKKKAKQS